MADNVNLKSTKAKSMTWKESHDVMLTREMLLFEPWLQRHGSVERGLVWKRIAESLNQLENPQFKVDDRAVRDRFKVLEKKQKRKISDEAKASGISPAETELHIALADIIERFEEADKQQQMNADEKKHKLAKETAQAEEMRRESLETFSETRNRKKNDGDEVEESVPKKKTKTSTGSDTFIYLREKCAMEVELRKQELEVKKAEVTERQKEQEQMHQFLQAQQQQTSQLLNQQQQINIALLTMLQKFAPS